MVKPQLILIVFLMYNSFNFNITPTPFQAFQEYLPLTKHIFHCWSQQNMPSEWPAQITVDNRILSFGEGLEVLTKDSQFAKIKKKQIQDFSTF